MNTNEGKPKPTANYSLTTDQRLATRKYLRAKLRQAERAFKAAKLTASMGAAVWSHRTMEHWQGVMAAIRWTIAGLGLPPGR